MKRFIIIFLFFALPLKCLGQYVPASKRDSIAICKLKKRFEVARTEKKQLKTVLIALGITAIITKKSISRK